MLEIMIMIVDRDVRRVDVMHDIYHDRDIDISIYIAIAISID